MAKPEADRRDVDESQEALGDLVVVGCDVAGVVDVVKALLDEVPQPAELAVEGVAQFPGFPHGDDRNHIAQFHVLSMLSKL